MTQQIKCLDISGLLNIEWGWFATIERQTHRGETYGEDNSERESRRIVQMAPKATYWTPSISSAIIDHWQLAQYEKNAFLQPYLQSSIRFRTFHGHLWNRRNSGENVAPQKHLTRRHAHPWSIHRLRSPSALLSPPSRAPFRRQLGIIHIWHSHFFGFFLPLFLSLPNSRNWR